MERPDLDKLLQPLDAIQLQEEVENLREYILQLEQQIFKAERKACNNFNMNGRIGNGFRTGIGLKKK